MIEFLESVCDEITESQVCKFTVNIYRSHFYRRRTYYVVPIAYQRLKYSYFFKAYFDIFKAICPEFKFLQNEKKSMLYKKCKLFVIKQARKK